MLFIARLREAARCVCAVCGERERERARVRRLWRRRVRCRAIAGGRDAITITSSKWDAAAATSAALVPAGCALHPRATAASGKEPAVPRHVALCV